MSAKAQINIHIWFIYSSGGLIPILSCIYSISAINWKQRKTFELQSSCASFHDIPILFLGPLPFCYNLYKTRICLAVCLLLLRNPLQHNHWQEGSGSGWCAVAGMNELERNILFPCKFLLERQRNAEKSAEWLFSTTTEFAGSPPNPSTQLCHSTFEHLNFSVSQASQLQSREEVFTTRVFCFHLKTGLITWALPKHFQTPRARFKGY